MKENVKEFEAFKSGKVKMPAHLQPKGTEEGKLFKSKFMERVTRTPLWVPQVMFVSTIIGFIYYNIENAIFPKEISVIMYVVGLLSWSFIEYIVHRFVYHTETNSDAFLSVQHSAHGIHHQHPRDKDRLAMPPLPGIILASSLFGLFYLIILSSE
jgi:sterol desaturase/sphingolipid hydroxylase (fatty acid hydroxylase superfamily)